MAVIDECSQKHWDMIGRNGCMGVARFVEDETEKNVPTMFRGLDVLSFVSLSVGIVMEFNTFAHVLLREP
ncbi:hypothetical protein E2C01_088421 [Portunus trituberculatus]|uniref:Uncharacterized protein n=1 Tax=Portunus trituberculatus TaxID=210409 RepID=A0A5B7JJC0_PORTR|nr:hypothetical protein [Portunus trituberculatus]